MPTEEQASTVRTAKVEPEIIEMRGGQIGWQGLPGWVAFYQGRWTPRFDTEAGLRDYLTTTESEA